MENSVKKCVNNQIKIDVHLSRIKLVKLKDLMLFINKKQQKLNYKIYKGKEKENKIQKVTSKKNKTYKIKKRNIKK